MHALAELWPAVTWRNARWVAAGLALLLAACGGGSSGGGSPTSGSGVPPGPTPATCATPATGTESDETAPAGDGNLRVTTTNGTLEGALDNGVRAFTGVRFAAPPTGCLRFRPPAPPVFAEGMTQATGESPRCIQIFNGSLLGEEDCLFLNVWAPDDAATHPVMVWLHGGNINGLNASRLAAATGLVIVAPNRRVGIMGTMSLRELAVESPDHATGTYAVQDTLAALRWVQRNAAAFGGDPARVMITGSSAGGSIACSLFAAPAATGLFSSAAVMSGVCHPRFVVDASLAAYSSAPPLEDVHSQLIATTGCASATNKLDCLRNVPAATLVDAAVNLPPLPGGGPAVPFAPIIDGAVVVSDPFSALEQQVAGSIRLVAGSTRDEMRSLFPLPEMDDVAYRSWLVDHYGSIADALYDLYPSAQYPTPTDAAYMFLSDLAFGCPAEALARAAGSNRPAHLFLVTRAARDSAYAVHGADFPYLFDTLEAWGIPVDQSASDLRSAMQSAWAGIAGAPEEAPIVDAGSQGSFVWPEFATGSEQIVDFGDVVSISGDHRGGRCVTLDMLLPP
jgi:para-nitrobenzyl esterase